MSEETTTERTPEEKIQENKKRFEETFNLITRNGADRVLRWLTNKTDFFIAPASSRFHGVYEGGLLEHSLNVYDQLKMLATGQGISDESIAICGLLHDVCKTGFYVKGVRNVKVDGKWKEVPSYEINDSIPLGHGEKSVILIQQLGMTLTLEEALAIRWHMGAFDTAFKGGDYGLSKALETSKLVLFLQTADMMANYFLER